MAPALDLRTLSPGEFVEHAEAFLAIAADVPGEYWGAENFLRDLPDKWRLSFAAWDGSDPVGYAVLSRKAPTHVHLHHFMIAAGYRGAGLGTRMVGEMVERARSSGALSLTLKVNDARAESFYRRNDFQEVDREGEYLVLEREFASCVNRRPLIAIHQPNYLPWLGYFRKIACCDTFVFMDNARLPLGKSYVSRNEIKTALGRRWLTVPIHKSPCAIADVKIDGDHWAKKHIRTLSLEYGKAPYRALIEDALEPLLLSGAPRIADLNIALILRIANLLGLADVRFLRASELALAETGAASVEEILVRLDARAYVTGKGAGTRKTIDPERLAARGIELHYLSGAYPSYAQLHGAFERNLSVVDALLCVGPEGTRALIDHQPLSVRDAL